ncbi:MAG: TlpA family protein disulfide reductase [Sphingobacteriaceae bacterium]|nr:MAG: TlpA family protein disulfide reductase [Sphingobacteriaceae bacterium]
MSCIIKRLFKPVICITILLFCNAANGQQLLLQRTINNIENYKNLSYTDVYKQKEAFGDTLKITNKIVLFKVPDDKEIGYFFRHEFKFAGMKVPTTEIYNGKSLVLLNPADSTFHTRKYKAATFGGSLLGSLNWMKIFLKENPAKIIQSPDTLFNSLNSYHLILKIRDTVTDNVHQYLYRHLFIEKKSGLPVAIINRSRSADFGKEITNYYNEDDYSRYKINQEDINATSFDTPKWFHLPKEKSKGQTAALLKQGDIAPDWILHDTNGKKNSLAEMKGKIVLLDFFFVGCGPCLQSLASLDRLQEKYKNRNFEILSISDRDSKKLVTDFKKVQNITNQIYPEGGDVAKLYRVTAAPTFYLIDQQGKIASVTEGYLDSFENNMSTTIDRLLNK